jgi:hypothetical protein
MALAPVGGTLLLLASGGLGIESAPGRLLASRPLVFLGQASYGWYLWHWPLMVLGGVLMPGIGPLGRLGWGVAGLGCAILMHRTLERPVQETLVPRVLAGRPLLVAGLVSGVLVLLGLGSSWASTRLVQHSGQRRYVEARNDHLDHDCWGRTPARVRRDGCAFGATGSATRLALIGDSHASLWLGGLEAAGREHGWRIEAYVMGACPVADLRGLIGGAAARLYRECGRFLDATLLRLEAEKPQAVVLSNSDFYIRAEPVKVPEAVWAEGLRRTYARLGRAGITVIVMRGTPWVPFDVPSCLSRRAGGLPFATDCRFVPDRGFMARAQRAQDRAARGLGVRFLDLNDRVCGAGPCATERDGLVLYSDDNHLTRSFSRSLAPPLGERLAAALSNP